MGDGYFYTLSAIAQSFAAIIALNGVFVIYKLQVLKNRRSELLTNLRMLRYKEEGGDSGFEKDREQAKKLLELISDEAVLSWASNNKGRSDIVAEKTKLHDDIYANKQTSKTIFYWFRLPLIFNGIAIISSLMLLPLKKAMSCSLNYIVVALVVLLSIVALLMTGHSVLITIELGGIPIIEKIFGKKSKS